METLSVFMFVMQEIHRPLVESPLKRSITRTLMRSLLLPIQAVEQTMKS